MDPELQKYLEICRIRTNQLFEKALKVELGLEEVCELEKLLKMHRTVLEHEAEQEGTTVKKPKPTREELKKLRIVKDDNK